MKKLSQSFSLNPVNGRGFNLSSEVNKNKIVDGEKILLRRNI
jgi:hypothetical protein